MLLKNLLLLTFLFLVPLASGAAQTDSALFKNEILGKSYCYKNSPNSGWIFTDDKKAIKHAVTPSAFMSLISAKVKYMNS